jgi:hypothetical protein
MMSVTVQNSHAEPNSVMTPADVMHPIFEGTFAFSPPRVNQRFPSEPLVVLLGSLFAVGTLNCLSALTGAAWAAESVAPTWARRTSCILTLSPAAEQPVRRGEPGERGPLHLRLPKPVAAEDERGVF